MEDIGWRLIPQLQHPLQQGPRCQDPWWSITVPAPQEARNCTKMRWLRHQTPRCMSHSRPASACFRLRRTRDCTEKCKKIYWWLCYRFLPSDLASTPPLPDHKRTSHVHMAARDAQIACVTASSVLSWSRNRRLWRKCWRRQRRSRLARSESRLRLHIPSAKLADGLQVSLSNNHCRNKIAGCKVDDGVRMCGESGHSDHQAFPRTSTKVHNWTGTILKMKWYQFSHGSFQQRGKSRNVNTKTLSNDDGAHGEVFVVLFRTEPMIGMLWQATFPDCGSVQACCWGYISDGCLSLQPASVLVSVP